MGRRLSDRMGKNMDSGIPPRQKSHRDHSEKLVEAHTTELTVVNEQLEREIAERQQAEETLRESEANLRSLLENATNFGPER